MADETPADKPAAKKAAPKKAKAKKHDGLVSARQGFRWGQDYVAQGEVREHDDPCVVRHPHLFEPVEQRLRTTRRA